MKTKYLFTVLSSLVLAVAVSTISVEAKAQVRPPKVVVALLDETLSFPYFEESKQKMARVLVPELESSDQFFLYGRFFDPDRTTAVTVLGRACVWLMCYETYLQTGHWPGPAH